MVSEVEKTAGVKEKFLKARLKLQTENVRKNDDMFCPECGTQLVPAEGCVFCPSCGWSPCK